MFSRVEISSMGTGGISSQAQGWVDFGKLFTWRWAWTFYPTAVASLGNLASSGLVLAKLQSKGGREVEEEEEEQEENKTRRREQKTFLCLHMWPEGGHLSARKGALSHKTPMTSGLWTPNLQKNEKNKCLLFKPPRLWNYLVGNQM